MKTVMLLRHAKSDWDASYDQDFDRPLAKRGRKAAKKIGRFMAANKLTPDLVLASTAVRARTTLELAMEAGEWEAPVEWSEQFYLADPEVFLESLQAVTGSTERILLVGHEPTCSMLVSGLTGGGSVAYPTAALSSIEFETSTWADVRYGVGVLEWLLPPALL